MLDQSHKTLGQLAYERDLIQYPSYPDGKPRKAWGELCALTRWSWERNPL